MFVWRMLQTLDIKNWILISQLQTTQVRHKPYNILLCVQMTSLHRNQMKYNAFEVKCKKEHDTDMFILLKLTLSVDAKY